MCSVTLNSTSTTAGSMSSFCSGMMLLPYQSSYLPGVWNVVWMMSLFYLKRRDMAINTHPHACRSTLSISSSPLPRLSASTPPRLHALSPCFSVSCFASALVLAALKKISDSRAQLHTMEVEKMP